MEEKGIRVLLSVTGKSREAAQGDTDGMHLVTTGELTRADDAWHLRYDETQPDGGQTHHVTLTMGGGVVTMQRDGAYNTSMVFEKGRRFQGSYNTPYGALDMGVYATQVRYDVKGAQGEVALRYQLDLQGQFASMHELHIRFVQNAQ